MNDREGMELITKKVEKCVAMAYTGNTPRRDWNFGRNGSELYTSDFLSRWPVDIYISTAGKDVLTGHELLPQTPDNNPVKEIYRLYNGALENGRSSWDQIAVLFAVQPHLFEIDSIGSLWQNADYETYWDVENNNPKHKRINPIISNRELEIIIEKMMAELPLNMKP